MSRNKTPQQSFNEWVRKDLSTQREALNNVIKSNLNLYEVFTVICLILKVTPEQFMDGTQDKFGINEFQAKMKEIADKSGVLPNIDDLNAPGATQEGEDDTESGNDGTEQKDPEE